MGRGPDKDLMACIDKDGDGHISFEEFVDWLTDPTASQTLHSDGWFGSFDFQELVKPLFHVFDRDGSGSISMEEFCECQAILSSSLALHPSANQEALLIDKDALGQYRSADRDGDGSIDLVEFTKWQAEIIRKSAIPNSAVLLLLRELAESLADVFHIDMLQKEGGEVSGLQDALGERVKQIAAAAGNLYKDQAELDRIELEKQRGAVGVKTVYWKDPPPDENSMNALMRTCASDLGLRCGKSPTRKSTRGSSKQSSTLAISTLGQVRLCIPELDQAKVNWLVQVAQQNLEGDETVHYYRGGKTTWKPIGEQEFLPVLEVLPKEVQIYAVVLAQAMGRRSIRFKEALKALEVAVKTGKLRPHAITRVQQEVEKLVEDDDDLQELHISPSEVMHLLVATGLQVHADVLAQLYH